MKSFEAVAQEGHLTRASKKLFISQSALSAQIIALEKELGTPLFIRSPQGMELTEGGELALIYAREMICLASDLKAALAKTAGKAHLRLRVGLQTDPSFLRIPDIDARTAEEVPGLRVQYRSVATKDHPGLLKAKEVDACFVYGAVTDQTLEACHLADVPTRIVIPNRLLSEYKVRTVRDLEKIPFIWFAQGCPFHKVLHDYFVRNGLKLKDTLHSADEGTILDFIRNEMGLALLREDQATALANEADITVWDQVCLTVPLALVWQRENGAETVMHYRNIVRGIWQT